MGTATRLITATLCLLLLHAGAGAAAETAGRQDRGQQKVPDGAELYQANCAGCHGSLTSSNKRGRTSAQIQNAINANIGGMGFLSKLSPSEVKAVSAALR